MTDRPPPPGEAGAIVRRLGLAAHPEGGWYRETWRAPAIEGARPASTAILFLLAAGEQSRWHRVDADEIWLHQAGGPLALAIGSGADHRRVCLGQNADAALQAVVPTGAWQAARPLGAWSLVACVVAPGFDFAGFEMASPGWAPEGGQDFLSEE